MTLDCDLDTCQTCQGDGETPEPAERWIGITCECGRADVIGVLIVRLGGSILIHPLTWQGAIEHAADWRCADCIADACRLLHLTPTQAAAELARCPL